MNTIGKVVQRCEMKYEVNEQYSISYGHRNNTNLEQSKHGPLYKKVHAVCSWSCKVREKKLENQVYKL